MQRIQNTAGYSVDTSENYFKVSVFCLYLDSLIESLNTRFSEVFL